jgi:hypothetical protein
MDLNTKGHSSPLPPHMPPTTTNASGQEASDHAGYAGKRINDFILPPPPSAKIQKEMIPADDFSGAFIKSYTLYLDKTGFHNNT